jgi:hypothetical protein
VATKNPVSYLEFIQTLDEWREYPSRRLRLALYRCNHKGCGQQTKQHPGNVLSKRVISCGCYNKNWMHRVKDYAGKTVGRFHILHFVRMKKVAPDQRRSVWRAICLNCKQKVDVNTNDIYVNSSPCNCMQPQACTFRARQRRIKKMLADVLFYQENPMLKGKVK